YAARLALDRWSNVAVISVRRPAGLVTASPSEEHGLAFLAASLRFVNGPFFVWVDRSIKRSGVALGTCRIDPRGGLSPELHAHADNLGDERALKLGPLPTFGPRRIPHAEDESGWRVLVDRCGETR